jgi:aromatic ring hydroxylase-like protein
VRGGQGILSRFLLVLGNDVEASTTEAAQQLAGSFPDVLELRLAPHPGIMLVRPDGYIAYATHSRDGVSALASLRAVLERQTQ